MRRDFVEIRAYCKINLALDILRLREMDIMRWK